MIPKFPIFGKDSGSFFTNVRKRFVFRLSKAPARFKDASFSGEIWKLLLSIPTDPGKTHTSDMSKVQIWKDCFFINRFQSWVRNWYVPEVCWFVGIFLNASHGCFKFHRAPEPYGILNDQKKGEIPWVLDDQDRRKHSTHISICIHVYVYTDIYIYTCIPNVYAMYMSVSTSIYMSISMSTSMSVYMHYVYVCIHIYIYVCLRLCPPPCLYCKSLCYVYLRPIDRQINR